MDKTDIPYSPRIEDQRTGQDKTKRLDDLLPEWVQDLRGYFGKKPEKEKLPYQNGVSHSHE